MNYQGFLIYRTRIQRSWNQAGLCKGICTVSYLSKIETGKTEPSEEILQQLMARLELKIDKEAEREAAELANRGWELLLDGRYEILNELLQRFKPIVGRTASNHVFPKLLFAQFTISQHLVSGY